MWANRVVEKFLKKLVGRKDIEDALRRLDRLTQEEALMAAAQILSLTHTIDNKVTGVGNKLRDVDDKIDVVIEGMPPVFIHSPYLDCAYVGQTE
jgi:hypothetical protein